VYVDFSKDLPESHIMKIKWHYNKANPLLHYDIATPNSARPSDWVAYEEVDEKLEGGEKALIAYWQKRKMGDDIEEKIMDHIGATGMGHGVSGVMADRLSRNRKRTVAIYFLNQAGLTDGYIWGMTMEEAWESNEQQRAKIFERFASEEYRDYEKRCNKASRTKLSAGGTVM
ncbi:hypothetical protein QFC24_006518, partial [Naganishia onofrii]